MDPLEASSQILAWSYGFEMPYCGYEPDADMCFDFLAETEDQAVLRVVIDGEAENYVLLGIERTEAGSVWWIDDMWRVGDTTPPPWVSEHL